MDQPGFPSQTLDNSTSCGDTSLDPKASSAPCDAVPGEAVPEHGAKSAPAGAVSPSKRVERPLTIGQVQRILEMRLGFTVSQNALARWCRQGKIYAVRLGYEWRIPRETVEEIIRIALAGERL